MNVLQVVVAEGATNLVTNPSFEKDTDGWTAVGASTALVQSVDYQRYGAYSLKVTPDTGVNDGVYFALTLSASTQYTATINVYGANGTPYQVYFWDVTAGAVLGSATTWTGAGAWSEQTVTATTGANTSIRLYIAKNNSADTTAFYVDGVQVEAKGYATTFCDGDQDGCEWTGAEHASTSTRDARSRAGGRVYNLGTANLTEAALMGAGMPPVRLLAQDQPLLPGALYQRTKVQPRIITVVFAVDGLDTSTYRSERTTLISRLKPDDVQ